MRMELQIARGKQTERLLRERIRTFRIYMHSSKFNWPDDYVRTHEVLSFLDQLMEEMEV